MLERPLNGLGMLLVDNIGGLATLSDGSLSKIADAAVLIDGERIFWCGPKEQLPDVNVDQRIDANGLLVIPGLIDCHTHLLFAGERAQEFASRMRNESYQSIMKKGGGILSTTKAFHQASDQYLLELARKRADQILAQGVTTIEAKSGYGLNLKEELRALKLLNMLNDGHSLDIHPTFLGAHVVPAEYGHARDRYLDLIDEMLEKIAEHQLAIDCDVFCETGAFSVDETRRILTKANALGLGLKAHLHQLSNTNAISLVLDLPLKSISHADYLAPHDMAILATGKAVVETLPIAALFLRSPVFTPVEELMAVGVKLAIATDFNPGSAMCHDLVLAARLGVTLFRFSVDAALCAITSHAAKALGRDDIGSIARGHLADLVITNCADINEFFYDWTKNPVSYVIKRGKVVVANDLA